jgi:hypothetical protein
VNRVIAGAYLASGGDISVANNIGNQTHRIQQWDFSKCLIPDISNSKSLIALDFDIPPFLSLPIQVNAILSCLTARFTMMPTVIFLVTEAFWQRLFPVIVASLMTLS